MVEAGTFFSAASWMVHRPVPDHAQTPRQKKTVTSCISPVHFYTLPDHRFLESLPLGFTLGTLTATRAFVLDSLTTFGLEHARVTLPAHPSCPSCLGSCRRCTHRW